MKKKTLTELLPEVRERIVMREMTTFGVGGVVDYYYEARTVENLSRAIKSAISLEIPYFILGNGSNILFSDYGFAGLVIKNHSSNIAIMRETAEVIADSGVQLSRLIMEAISNDLAGIEFLYGVPGTVGGATYGNAGAWGSSVGDYVKNLTILELDPEDNIPKIVQRAAPWMEFGYRTSHLKKIKSKFKPVILTVRFQFAHNQKEELMRRLNKYKKARQNQPAGPTVGSVFKNPIPPELKNITGKGTKGMPEVPRERTAGFMLDSSGAKKLRVGTAEVSSKHANFIINHGAKAQEIRALIEAMREKVRQKYDVTLEEEIEYIGQW